MLNEDPHVLTELAANAIASAVNATVPLVFNDAEEDSIGGMLQCAVSDDQVERFVTMLNKLTGALPPDHRNRKRRVRPDCHQMTISATLIAHALINGIVSVSVCCDLEFELDANREFLNAVSLRLQSQGITRRAAERTQAWVYKLGVA